MRAAALRHDARSSTPPRTTANRPAITVALRFTPVRARVVEPPTPTTLKWLPDGVVVPPVPLPPVAVVVVVVDTVVVVVVLVPKAVVLVRATVVVVREMVVLVRGPLVVVVEREMVVVGRTIVVVVVERGTVGVAPTKVVVVLGTVVVVAGVGRVVVVDGVGMVVDDVVVVGPGMVVVVVVGGAAHMGRLTVLLSSVTAPLRASSRPITEAPVWAVMEVSAMIVPTNTELVPSVAELPTCQNTLHAWA